MFVQKFVPLTLMKLTIGLQKNVALMQQRL